MPKGPQLPTSTVLCRARLLLVTLAALLLTALALPSLAAAQQNGDCVGDPSVCNDGGEPTPGARGCSPAEEDENGACPDEERGTTYEECSVSDGCTTFEECVAAGGSEEDCLDLPAAINQARTEGVSDEGGSDSSGDDDPAGSASGDSGGGEVTSEKCRSRIRMRAIPPADPRPP